MPWGEIGYPENSSASNAFSVKGSFAVDSSLVFQVIGSSCF